MNEIKNERHELIEIMESKLKRMSFTVKKENQKKFDFLKTTLKERGVFKVSFNKIFNEAISSISSKKWEEYKDEMTPNEWKIEQALMNNPEKQREVLKLLEKLKRETRL